MVVHVRGPSTIERYEPRGVDGTHEDVLGDEIALAPSEQLIPTPEGAQCRVPALAHAQEPVPVRVVAVLEPLVDQDVGRVVVERLADEFAHGHARRVDRRVNAGLLFRRRHLYVHGRGEVCCCRRRTGWKGGVCVWCVEIGKLIKPKKRPTREVDNSKQTVACLCLIRFVAATIISLSISTSFFWVQSSVYTRRPAPTHMQGSNLGYSTVI